MKTVLLTHYSRHPDAKGDPGDIVDAPDALADGWIATRGAVLVRAPRPAKVTPALQWVPTPAEAVATAEQTEQPIKRKRGRPRKNVATDQQPDNR